MDERGLVVTFHVSTKTMVEYSSMMGKFPTVYFTLFYSVFRIHMFFCLQDPDPLVRGMDPDPSIQLSEAWIRVSGSGSTQNVIDPEHWFYSIFVLYCTSSSAVEGIRSMRMFFPDPDPLVGGIDLDPHQNVMDP